MPKFNSYLSTSTFITFVNNQFNIYFNLSILWTNGTNYTYNEFSFYRWKHSFYWNDTVFFPQKKRRKKKKQGKLEKNKNLHTRTNGRFVLKSKWKFFFNNHQQKHFLSSRGSIRSWSILLRGATQDQQLFFPLPPPLPNQITESPSPQAGWIIVDSTSINLRDITSQYSFGFTLLDAPFSSLISSSTRLI